MTSKIRAALKIGEGTLPAFAWPGGYDVVYYCPDGEELCAKCAQEALTEDLDWAPVDWDTGDWIEDPVSCSHCSTPLCGED